MVAAEQPLLIVLEDAHWCDSASWALAWLVSQQIPRVLLVLRCVRWQMPLEYGRLRDVPDGQRLHLDPLPARDVTALVALRLRVSSVPRLVAELIGEHAGGNPFFSEELAYALRDTGAITVTDGRCQIAQGPTCASCRFPTRCRAWSSPASTAWLPPAADAEGGQVSSGAASPTAC